MRLRQADPVVQAEYMRGYRLRELTDERLLHLLKINERRASDLYFEAARRGIVGGAS